MSAPAVNDAGSDSYAVPDPGSTRAGRRRAAKSMDELETQFKRGFEAAFQYAESTLSPARTKAMDAYNGEPYGDEEEGRSQVVSRDVRDLVRVYMPDLLRIYFGGRNVWEFLPQKASDTQYAQQATDYINQIVIAQDNPGYLIHSAAFMDALILRTGWFKWWWDTRREVKSYHFTGKTEAEVKLLGARPHVTKIHFEKNDDDPTNVLYEVWLTIETPSIGKARFDCVPNEEIFVTPGTRRVSDALGFYHSQMTTVGNLVAMGYDEDEVTEYAEPQGASTTAPTVGGAAIEAASRRPDEPTSANTGQMDPLLRAARYTEGYTFNDVDGDGYAELVKVCAVGRQMHVLAYEPVDEIPFSYITPMPTAHEISGESIYDGAKDIQRIKTAAQRFMLDAFSQSVNPGWEAVEDMVDLDDLANSEIGRTVRVKQPGMLRELVPTATGQQMFSVLDYYDKVRDDRFKQTAMSQGLDGNQLQSTEKQAAASQLSTSAAEREMVARNFGETGIRDLALGLLRLTIKHEDKARTVLLNGEWEQIQPSLWDLQMAVQINVGLGPSGIEEKKAAIQDVLTRQEGILTTAGFDNPICGPAEYRNALADLSALTGRKDASRYWKVVPDGYQTPQPPPPPPSDAQILSQVQTAELEWKKQKDTAQHALDIQKAQNSDLLERLKIEADFRAKIYVADITAKVTGEQSRIDAETDRLSALIEGHSATQVAGADLMARMHQTNTQAATDQSIAAMQPPAPAGAPS